MKSFTQNADNFISKDIIRNAEVNKSENLAQKFGYSDQDFARIKALAEMQFLDGISTVSLQHEGMSINSPWIDGSARFELTDVGAVNCYGEGFLRSWCAKAHEVLKDEKSLNQLKQWSEKTSYREGFPYRNPIEQYGLAW